MDKLTRQKYFQTPKTKLTKEQFKRLKGSIDAHQYRWDEKKKLYIKELIKIKGIAEAKRKAPTYVLGANVAKVGVMFIKDDGTLTYKKKEAKVFYHGWDDPQKHAQIWGKITGLKLFSYNL